MTNKEWFQLIVAAENIQMTLGGLVETLRSASQDSEIDEAFLQTASELVHSLAWEVGDTCERVEYLLD